MGGWNRPSLSSIFKFLSWRRAKVEKVPKNVGLSRFATAGGFQHGRTGRPSLMTTLETGAPSKMTSDPIGNTPQRSQRTGNGGRGLPGPPPRRPSWYALRGMPSSSYFIFLHFNAVSPRPLETASPNFQGSRIWWAKIDRVYFRFSNFCRGGARV